MEKFNLKKYQEPKPKKGRKYKVCFYSNSPNIATGYAKVIREVCSRLANDPAFEIHTIGENYVGPPQQFQNYTMWGMDPAIIKHDKQDTFFPAFLQAFSQIKPDVLIVLEDTFTLAHQGWYDWSLKYGSPCKFIMYLPLDGKWTPTNGLPILRMADKIVSMAKFTQWAAQEDGFQSSVIYHGVDLFKFKPVTAEQKKQLRKKYGFPEDCFLIFNYGRNNMRKSNPQLCRVIAEYLKDKDPKKFKAFLHIMNFTAPDGNLIDLWNRVIEKDVGINFLETGHVFMNPKAVDYAKAPPDEEVAEYIQMSDLVVSATTGEGFGLIMAEAAACQIPVIHPDYTTPRELLVEEYQGIGPRGMVVPCDTTYVSSFNTEHAFVNISKMVEAIDYLQKNPQIREEMGKNGRQFVEAACNWDYIVEQWKETIREVCD